MSKPVQLSASLLAADFGIMRMELQRAEAAGVDRFHFDFMDGHYVPNLALSPDHIRALRRFSELPFDVHLELSNPEQILEGFNMEGVSTVILQADTLSEPARIFDRVHQLGLRVGLSVNPDEQILPQKPLLAGIDQFLILGVQPGFGGQQMHPETPLRVRELAVMAGDQALEVAVDGGVNLDNAAELVAAGADVLVVGTAIFQAENLEATVRAFKDLQTPA